MTIISSGALALQDLGTNTSSSVDNQRLSTSFTAGVDGLLQIQQLNEVGDGQFVPSTVWQGDAYGYNNGMFSTSYIHGVFNLSNGPGYGDRRYNSVSNFGSLGTSGYFSADGTSRTISGVFWGLPDASPNNVRLFIFALNGTGVTNSDTAAWSKIEITTNGGTTVTINRTDLSYDSSENGDSWWWWKGSSGTMYTNVGNLGTPSSSSYTIKVIGGTTTATLNNGIAEEFGGNDSSNVKMSDYYKGAASGFVNTGTGTANIPTTGNPIAFSDFYGASYVSGTQAFTDITAGYTFYTYTGGRGSTQYGFDTGYRSQNTSAPTGSISYTDDLIVGSTNIGSLYRADCEGLGQLRHRMQVELTNSTNSNSGFTNIVFSRIGGASTTIARTALTYSYSSGRRIYISATELDSALIYTAGGSGTSRYCKYWGSTAGFSAGTGTDSSATGRVEFT